MSAAAVPIALATPRAHAPSGYFQRTSTAALILGAFACVTLPMAALVLFLPVAGVVWLYLWLFGMTHFVVTFAIYLQSKNLRHFVSSPKNIVTFCVIPIALFCFFDAYQALQIAVLFPLANLAFRGVIRMADFFHWARQSFGVLQLFKAASGAKFPAWHKTIENRFFLALAALLLCTFLEGVRSLPSAATIEGLAARGAIFPLLKPVKLADAPAAVLQAASALLLLTTLTLFAAVLAGYVHASRQGYSVRKAVLYLFAQTASACLAVAWFPLYLATLAIHYVEYQVVMAPRCFRTPLDAASRLDRAFGWFRKRPILFYANIIAAAGAVALLVRQSMDTMIPGAGDLGRSMPYLMLISAFDGIFVFHYFVEAFIWKFSDPYFRQSMSGLYLASPSK